MAVGVDEARQDRLALTVDRLRGLVLLADLVGRPDRHDAPAVDRDGAVQEDAAVGVHRHDGAAGQQQVDHQMLLPAVPASPPVTSWPGVSAIRCILWSEVPAGLSHALKRIITN